MKTGDYQKKPTAKPKWQWGFISHLGVKSDSSSTLFPCTFCIIATKLSELKKKKSTHSLHFQPIVMTHIE